MNKGPIYFENIRNSKVGFILKLFSRNSDFVHYFEDVTKLKISSEIKPPLKFLYSEKASKNLKEISQLFLTFLSNSVKRFVDFFKYWGLFRSYMNVIKLKIESFSVQWAYLVYIAYLAYCLLGNSNFWFDRANIYCRHQVLKVGDELLKITSLQ